MNIKKFFTSLENQTISIINTSTPINGNFTSSTPTLTTSTSSTTNFSTISKSTTANPTLE